MMGTVEDVWVSVWNLKMEGRYLQIPIICYLTRWKTTSMKCKCRRGCIMHAQ